MKKIFIIMALMCCLFADAKNINNVVILGDSNSWLGGDGCDKQKGWTYWFWKYSGAKTCRSYARSGATWSHTTNTKEDTKENIGSLGDNNVILNQVLRLKEALNNGVQQQPDIIIVAAGTNDVWFKDKRPGVFDGKGPLSLDGAIDMNCKMLKQLCPKAKLVLLTPMQTVAADDKLIEKASEIIVKKGKELGAVVIRFDKESKVRSAKEKVKKCYTYDGTHTSILGAKSNGKLVADKLLVVDKLK